MKLTKLTKLGSYIVLGAVAAKSLLTGKKSGSGKTTLARAAVEAANARFREAVRLGKSGDIMALYAENAIILPPGQEMIKERAAIESYWRMSLESGVKDAVLTTADVEVAGDVIREIGTYALKIWPEGKSAWEENGKYVVLWRKGPEASVKIEVDIWNSSQPVRQK